ncbi:hypothetical protein GGI07_001889 [Coemansia sp. Benny D115]|nr:hypothetical protein GGI07_001889 [Coemansia sp. Benny D115]
MLRLASTSRSSAAATAATASRLSAALATRHHSTNTSGSSSAVGGTFSNQSVLPRLPVPDLKDTAARYLKSIEPLLTPQEYQQSVKAVNQFIGPDGLGPVLQQRLQEVDRQAKYSWLEDIWLKKAYLEWRGPSYINVNWFAALGDNPDFPLVNNVPRGQVTDVQLQRAARVITHMLEANEELNAQKMAPDMQKGQPLCMAQFQWQFGTTRIPRMGCDELVHQYPSTARHILLMYRNEAVSVPVYGADGVRASMAQIIAQLALATQRVDKEIARRGPQPPVANLTAAHRDDWSQARELLEADASNRASLELADTSLFGICLDVDVNPETTADVERTIRVLAHSDAGANRWFDKAIQMIFFSNGRMGVNCEHTPVDALTTGRLLMGVSEKERGPLRDGPLAHGLAPPEPLQWNVSPAVAELITKARGDARDLASNLRLLLGGMPEYGAQWIKTLGVSPDAYFQVAIQAAHQRQHGGPAATYESASLRRFSHGRTETIRSCTSDSLAFAKALDDRDMPIARKLALFKQATTTHTQLTVAATSGQGVDRHLLGLRAQLRSAEEAEKASLFVDPAFALSSSFVLSTSNVTPGDRFRGAFAPVVADGYGINYAMDKNDIKFSLSDWLSSSKTDALAFRETIVKTLADLHEAGAHALSKQA